MIGKKKSKSREILKNNDEVYIWHRTNKRSQMYCGGGGPEPTKAQLKKMERKVKKARKARSKFVKDWVKKNLPDLQ